MTTRRARFDHADALLQADRPEEALAEIEKLLSAEPRDAELLRLKAYALETLEDHAAAADVWRGLLAGNPDDPDLLISLGNTLRGLGARGEAIAAFSRAIAIEPAHGSAWWALADLKTYRFAENDAARMEAALARSDLTPQNRLRLHFALGKAYGERADYERSFANYAKGNALYRVGVKHDPDTFSAYVARCKRLFTAEFLERRAGQGAKSGAPIFIVGLPRAGSTLIEQILASHSMVEGTRELTDLAVLARFQDYPEALARLDAAELNRLGESYLARTKPHRKLGKLRFTDKMGPNFVHAGFIRLILPNARIIDMRRHPLACGFSVFAQIFPQAKNDAYRLSDIGRHYRDYVDLMAHFDAEMPGTVHRVIYEELVADPRREIGRLLDHLGLPFEEACLDFHKTERVVATVSSEQVRLPLYRDALEQWRHYEPWLGPLKAALGPVLEAYPQAPAFD